jgi:hypothetical protein
MVMGYADISIFGEIQLADVLMKTSRFAAKPHYMLRSVLGNILLRLLRAAPYRVAN